jgi:hypothetical protein
MAAAGGQDVGAEAVVRAEQRHGGGGGDDLGVGGGDEAVGAVPLVEPLPGGGVGDDHARGPAVHAGVREDLVQRTLEAGVGGACPGGRAPGERAGEPENDGPDPGAGVAYTAGAAPAVHANHGSTHGTRAFRTGVCVGRMRRGADGGDRLPDP